MPRFISTYSRLRPVFKKADNDEFSQLQRCAAMKRKTKVAALKSIAESDTDDQDGDIVAEILHSKVTMNRKAKPVKPKSTRRKPTPLKIEGKGIGRRHYSPMARPSPVEDTSDENDDSILYLSDFSEENTTLSNTDMTVTNAETCEDSDNQYSDIELPRDLPEPKRKSSSASSRILKLSQMSNKKISHLKSQVKGSRKVDKPAHSTLLEGKFSAMNIDQFEISDISGNGPQYCSSESSSSYTLMGQDSPMPSGKETKSSSNISSGGQKLPENEKKARTTTRSVYSLLSNESETSPISSPLKKKGNEPKLKITGKKVPLLKKSPSKEPQPHHDNTGESSAKVGKKQVSFQLKNKPEVFDPVCPTMSTPFNVSLPHRSPSNSILKKTVEAEPSNAALHGKESRATSTPQKLSRHSRKAHGCHIMDLSFDVSAVTLPMDNDLVLTRNPVPNVEIQHVEQDKKSQGHKYGEATENLLDFEPMCLQASENIGSLLEATPVKDDRRKQNEVTPSTQLKRHSPDAGTPSKQLPKKSRIIKPSGDAGLNNRKRLNYQQPVGSEPMPECVITTLPFPGYKHHPSIEPDPPKPGPVNMNHLRKHPQGKAISLLR